VISFRTLAVTCVAAGTLAFEILLVRVFAIEHFHHFAYMAIGIAMLGFGASGTVLALIRPRDDRTAARWFWWASVAVTLALILSPAMVHQVPFDATQLAWDYRQWLRLGLVYLLLALPFGIGGFAIILAVTLEADRPGRIYGASFIGSGLGAGLALGVLWFIPPVGALAVPALIAALGTLAAAFDSKKRPSALRVAGLVLLGSVIVVLRPPWRFTMTPYKALPQVEAYPEARRVAERISPLGWVVAVQAPAFRYAPGLSLRFSGELPQQTGLFVDGELASAVTDWNEAESAFAVLDWLPSAAPYVLGQRDGVLVIGGGGGTEVANAQVHGATRITAVELHPDLLELADRFGAMPRHHGQPEARWVIGDARHFVSRSHDSFDLITLGPGGAFGAATGGVHALGEDFLHTREAYAAYLSRLRDGGVLSVTGWLALPPRQNVRVILTMAEAVRQVHGRVGDGLVVVRSWGTVTVMAKPNGFSTEEIGALRTWSAARNFDVDYPVAEVPADPFNTLDAPVFVEAAVAAVAGRGEASRFAETYPFDVAPVTDVRPYPHHYLRLQSLGAFFKSDRGTWLPFAEWGMVALLATLVQSVVLAGLLLILPVAVRARTAGESGLFPIVAYFSAIGFAYLAAEIAAIQQLGLLLGHPVYAVVMVLAAFLICSGAGSAWSDRYRRAAPATVAGILVLVLILFAAMLPTVVHLLQPAPLLIRAVVAFVLLGPVAFVMGMPFPMGIRAVAGSDSTRTAWAWASNGFASVTAAPVAALLALELGAVALLFAGGVAYGTAAISAQVATRSAQGAVGVRST